MVISYFSVRNDWLIWRPFLFIVGSHLLFGMPFTYVEQCFFFQFQGCFLIELACYACIISESVAPLWLSVSYKTHNGGFWSEKQTNLEFCRVQPKLNKNFTTWDWMVSATQKQSKNGGQITLVILNTIKEITLKKINYRCNGSSLDE